MQLLILLIFLLSRLIFINPDPVFFDSPEYLSRLSSPSFLNALTSGHLPLHIGYILIFWPIFHFGKLININPPNLVIFIQIILSLLSIFYYYQIVRIITNDKNLAFKSATIASLIPLYWIANVTIMMETTYITFFMLSLYFLIKYSRNLNTKPYAHSYLIFSVMSFIMSALTHLAILIWVPFLLYVSYSLNKKKFYICLFSLMGGFVVSSVLNGSIIAFSQKISLTQGILSLLTAKVGERAQFSFDIQSVLVFTRNFIIPLFRNYTILVVILAFLSLVKLYSINKKMFILSFLWIAPSLIANQWWDSVLFGRHSLIAGFGLALLAAYIIKNNKIAFSVLILYLLIASLATMSLLRGKIPYLREAKAIEELPKGGILIESHFARPQVDKLYKGKVVFVDEPRWEKEKLGDLIEETLIHKKNVFITAQALSEPYGLYSGPYLHILSLSYRNKFILKDIVEKFTLKEYRVINRNDNLIFYKVISSISSPYPLIESLKFHRRRIDFFDLFTQVWFIYAK